MAKTKLVYVIPLMFLLNMAFAGITLGQFSTSSVLIGTDDEGDMMIFNRDWLEDEYGDADSDDFQDSLNNIYNGLEEVWGQRKDEDEENLYRPTQTPEDSDISKLELIDLDKDTAKMCVSVYGNLRRLEDGFLLFVWSDCDSSGDEFIFVCVYMPSLGGSEDIGYYTYEYGDESGEDEVDVASTIEMEFPSELYDEDAECGVRAMLITTGEDWDDAEEYIIDIFPAGNDNSWLLFWIIFIIILIIILCAIIYYYYRKTR